MKNIFRNLILRILSKWRIRKGEKFSHNTRIVLRKIEKKEGLFIDEIRGNSLPKLDQARFRQQAKGDSLYLVAFIEKMPVGYIYINFSGTCKYHTSPVLQDLFVKSKLREQNIGTQIIQEAERILKSLNYKKLSLDVEVRNGWIQKLYEKQGFRKKGGHHEQSWIEEDSGKRVEIKVVYLEKNI